MSKYLEKDKYKSLKFSEARRAGSENDTKK